MARAREGHTLRSVEIHRGIVWRSLNELAFDEVLEAVLNLTRFRFESARHL